MSGVVAAGYVELVCRVGEGYGFGRQQLMAAASIQPRDLEEPDASVPLPALLALLRFLVERTNDASLGLRLAESFDLRTQGLWGYALLSSRCLRERIEIHQRYQSLRAPVSFTTVRRGDAIDIDVTPYGIPLDLLPIVLDWGFAGAIREHRRRIQRRRPELQLWLSYPERPHHARLQRLVAAPIVFDASCNRLRLPAADLDLPVAGDPQLCQLAQKQLDKLLRTRPRASTLEQVQERLRVSLESDCSLERIARDLGTSSRTLRRRLSASGATFHELLDGVRRELARDWLRDDSLSIDAIARQLGYRDASNFRRAFLRWQGVAPSAYRNRQRAALAEDDRSRPAMPLSTGLG